MEKNNMTFQTQIKEISEAIDTLLIEKNKRYGDSALNPNKIFYKGSAGDAILVRLNDKASRLANSDTPRLNDMVDMIGYLKLWLVSENVKKEDILKLID